MSFYVVLGGTDVTRTVVGKPTISDQLNDVCSTFTFSVSQPRNPQDFKGLTTQLWLNDVCWFDGTIKKQSTDDTGCIELEAYDPLFKLNRYSDDFYFKRQTATQIITEITRRAAVPLVEAANTEAVFSQLWYPAASGEKVCIDCLARTKIANGRKFWYRYDPVAAGVVLFERQVPENIWVFKRGLNLISANKKESITDVFTAIKLINRETGQVVETYSPDAAQAYGGNTQYFEEISDENVNLIAEATRLADEKLRPDITQNIKGINPDGKIPRLYPGDAIYAEEVNTGIAGGYYIRNITTTFETRHLITLDMEIVSTPDLPEIQFSDADVTTTEKPTKETTPESEQIVYVQPDGTLYHKQGCPVIADCTCRTMSKEAAKDSGALQCAVCKA